MSKFSERLSCSLTIAKWGFMGVGTVACLGAAVAAIVALLVFFGPTVAGWAKALGAVSFGTASLGSLATAPFSAAYHASVWVGQLIPGQPLFLAKAGPVALLPLTLTVVADAFIALAILGVVFAVLARLVGISFRDWFGSLVWTLRKTLELGVFYLLNMVALWLVFGEHSLAHVFPGKEGPFMLGALFTAVATAITLCWHASMTGAARREKLVEVPSAWRRRLTGTAAVIQMSAVGGFLTYALAGSGLALILGLLVSALLGTMLVAFVFTCSPMISGLASK